MMLSVGAIELLMKLIESEASVFRKDGLNEMGGNATDELIQAGLIVDAGHEFRVAAPTGVFAVVFDDRRRAYGYHDPEEGWIAVEKSDLERYRLDIRAVALALLGENLRMSKYNPVELHHQLFEIGSYPLLTGRPTPVWLMRSMMTAGDASVLGEAADRRPSEQVRIVLTPTSHDRMAATAIGNLNVVSIRDVLCLEQVPLIDIQMLRSRLEGRAPAGISSAISLSDDSSYLVINGEEFRFSGRIMKKAVRLLYDAYQTSKPIKLADLLEKSGSRSKDLDALFGRKWPRLKKHVLSDQAYYRLTAD